MGKKTKLSKERVSAAPGMVRREGEQMTARYDFYGRRWVGKPVDRAWSDYVIGRMAAHRTLMANRTVVVSCYAYRDGVRYVETLKECRPGKAVLYRIRVRLKPEVSAPAARAGDKRSNAGSRTLETPQ